MKPCGIAIIGCGTIGEFHLRAVREVPGAQLIGVAAKRPERAREVGEREGCHWVSEYRRLFDRTDVDLVTIATPSGSHASIALEAIAAGKHVLVEKPMAMTPDEAGRVIRAAAGSRRLLSVVSQRRFEEQHVAARRAVMEGWLGALLFIEAACPYFRPQEYYEQASWRGTIDADGGALMNQGIHSVDVLLWMAGPAKRVYSLTATRTHIMEAEDLAHASITFASGAFGTMMASTSIQPGFPPTLALYGEKGTIKIEGSEIVHWTVPGLPKPELGERITTGGGIRDPKAISHRYHVHQVRDVVDAIAQNRPPVVTGEDGLRAVALVDAIYRSARSGNPVTL